MTKKEAIRKVEFIDNFMQRNHSDFGERNHEAMRMAVEALEQSEIIRCAECKWFQCNMRPDGTLPKGVDEFECRHWCGGCDPVDFCSYAERGDEQ